MIPLSDPDIRRRTFPFVTITILALNVLVFLYQLTLNDLALFRFTYQFAVIPFEVSGRGEIGIVPVLVGQSVERIDLTSPIPTWATVFTSMFMHGGFMHIAGNMLFLWVFGDNIEDKLGHVKYLAFYILAGTAAALAQVLVNPDSQVPMVGASGAIAGVLGAYLVFYTRSRIHTLVFLGFFVTHARVPAIFMIGFWALLQFFNGFISLGVQTSGGGVAYVAHIGGFVVGVGVAFAWRILYPVFRLLVRGR